LASASNEKMAKQVEGFEGLLKSKNVLPSNYLEDYSHTVDEDWTAKNGAQLVARAWIDSNFKKRLLANGMDAANELGFSFPKHHRHFVVLENTADLHNVICCTLCSCTAFSIIGMPPSWYKEIDYRARIVRQSRDVLRELGLDLPDGMKLKVWDTTTDTRYMVLPYRPKSTYSWTEERLAELIDQDCLVGVKRFESPFGDIE
jgi:nitrile hydratase